MHCTLLLTPSLISIMPVESLVSCCFSRQLLQASDTRHPASKWVVYSAGSQRTAQPASQPSYLLASSSAMRLQHAQTSACAISGSAATHAGTSKQRSNSGRSILQSPFASCEVQQGQAQPEEIKPAPSRKRARCYSADLDCNSPSKLPHGSHKQQVLKAGALPDQTMVTLHKPTPHRPTASTPCCFGVVSTTQPLQHSQLRGLGLNTARPAPGGKSAACTVAPSSLATAATLAKGVTAGKSSGSDPSDDDRASPARQEHSQDCNHCPGELCGQHCMHWMVAKQPVDLLLGTAQRPVMILVNTLCERYAYELHRMHASNYSEKLNTLFYMTCC